MIRFGTDGIRGTAGRAPVTAEVGVAVGRAAVRLAGATDGPPRVLVCRDPRESGAMLEAAVAAGVMAQGGTVLLGGVLPTSGLATCLHAGLADTGVMLTASHNPHEDNGFKVFGRGGRKLSDAENAEVERWIAEGGPAVRPGELRDAADPAYDTYVSALARAVPERDALAGRRIAVDLAHGAATPLHEWLIEAVPADWVVVGDGSGRVNDGVGSENLERLQAVVVESGCDAGFAVDGDADRCVLVDRHGERVPGDALAWLLARGRGVKTLAVTVMSNAALEPALPGIRVIRTPVGDRHLLRAIAEEGAELGCEESGHVVFADALPAGDGIVTALRALALALRGGADVHEAVAGFRPFPRRVTKVRVAARPPLDEVGALQEARARLTPDLGRGGRVFLRYSGTEPVLRILVEGEDEAAVAQVSTQITRVAQQELA